MHGITHTINVASDIAAVGKTFNIISYDAAWAEHQTSKQSFKHQSQTSSIRY